MKKRSRIKGKRGLIGFSDITTLHGMATRAGVMSIHGTMGTFLSKTKGVVLGEFTDCKANLDFGSVEEMIASYLKDYGIPVLCGFPAGHGDVNLPLVMGAPVTLEVDENGGRLRFDIDGFRQDVWTDDALQESRDTVGTEIQKQRKLIRLLDFVKHYDGVRR